MTKYPTKVSDLPEGEFYAILTPESVTIPGDERSRTNPGHGYPEHSVEFWKMQTFSSREEWEAEITRLSGLVFGGQNFKAVVVKPAVVKTFLKVEVK